VAVVDVSVVYDLGGAGRVVGVFRSAYRANRVVAINPAYYRVTRCKLDDVADVAFEWLESMDQKDRLERLRRLRS
jgi:predicted RNA methylase